MLAPSPHDLVLVGGGLQNGLIALACWARNPALRIALVERDPSLGGNHTWCFHAADVPEHARAFIEPLIAHRYQSHDVRFPGFARTVHAPYAAITSERFHRVLSDAFAAHPSSTLRLGCSARELHADRVVLSDGTELHAPLVIDARGPSAHAANGASCGYQKFIGLELRLRTPCSLPNPILMDATVPQEDGFRFFYVLPTGVDRLLVEDTFFSTTPVLDEGARVEAILAYASRFGVVEDVLRQERGVLPMPYALGAAKNDHDAPAASPLLAGYAGGWFHPATGYSFPIALRLSLHVAACYPNVFGEPMRALYREHRTRARFAERLNALLFNAFAPEDMWNVFARFYHLPDELIARFYALTLTRMDCVRILVGRPPRGFSIAHALFGGSFGGGLPSRSARSRGPVGAS